MVATYWHAILEWSVWLDLNQRLSASRAGTLTRLSYTQNDHFMFGADYGNRTHVISLEG